MAKSAARSPADKDPAPPQTRRARRRLIGAAALAIAAAIVLTLVLDSEPRGTIREVEVSIPSRNTESADAGRSLQPTQPAARADSAGAIEGRVGAPMVPPPDEPPTAPVSPAAQPAGPAPSPAEPVETAEPAGSSTGPAGDSTSEPGAPTEQADVAADDEPQPRASGSPAKRRAPGADVAAAPGSAQAGNGAAPAPAARESTAGGKPPAPAPRPSATARPARAFSVQVGAFSTDESAQAQAQRVRDAGLPVYTEKILTAQGARIRVRAGPFGNGEEAERARAKLQLAGIESAVIKP